MAKTTKDSVKETAETDKAKEICPAKKTKIRMLRTYIGSAGCFYAGSTYESDKKIFSEFLKNKDAEEC